MAGKKSPDALIGQRVRINPDLLDASGTVAHDFAGQVGEVMTRNTGGNYQVMVGDAVKVIHISDMVPVVDTEDGTGRNQLLEEDPALIINSLTNPRRRKGLDIDSLSALAASIKVHGLGQPILVRKLPAHRLIDTADLSPRPIYEVVAGERRWRACQLAGVPITMLLRDMSDAAVLEMQLVENIEREDLDAMEEAEGFELLRQRLGYTPDQIAERIGHGKGRSYVYKALKLCDLTPESREAMYPAKDGAHPVLSRSTGLLVARYQPAQQAEVVAFIASMAGPGGEPAPFRTVQPALAKRYHLELAHAVFNIHDETLVLGVGACTTCPKRSGAQANIFEDAGGPDSCTDADCFAAKREAHVGAIKDQAQRDGIKVIDGEDARRARPAPSQRFIAGYVRLDDVARIEKGPDGKEREVTYGDALRALGKKAPKPRLFIDPHTSEASRVITAELADKLTPEEEEQPPAKRGNRNAGATIPVSAIDEPDNRPPAEVAICQYHVARAVLVRMFDAIRNQETRSPQEARLIGVRLFQRCEDQISNLPEYLGWGAPDDFEGSDREWDDMVAQHLAAMPTEQLGAVLAMAAAEAHMGCAWTRDDEAVALAASYGIDVLAVRDKVAEDMQRGQDKAIAKEGQA
ncbi:MAG: ParB/RepB/Spo0J family partition protein [Ramlibacter sp.]|nr:ParB/RepB/Spo0J family partition protein [Ramlibacter sp.]